MPDAAKGPGMTPRMWLKTGIRKIINNQLQWGRDDSPDVTAVADAALKEGTMLQWGRGSLPGCNPKAGRNAGRRK